MTTTGITTDRPAIPGAAHRIGAVVRLHFANPGTVLLLPLMILGIIFLANLAIWGLISGAIQDPGDRADAQEGFGFSGAATYLIVYMMVVAVQAMNQTFAFAQGFSVTRRDYYLGSSAAFLLLTLIYTAIYGVMGAIERATGGWGLGGRLFSPYWAGSSAAEQVPVVFLAFLFSFFVGAAVATIWVRWKQRGLLGFFAVLMALVVGAAALATWTGNWGSVGAWFASNGPLGVMAWSLVATVVAAVAGYLLLRRATPQQ